MFKQENIALAQIAQMFGSHLLNVQENAITDSGQKPSIVNIDPKQFLVPDAPSVSTRNKEQERELLLKLQREAEAACPLPPEISAPSQAPSSPPSVQKPLESASIASPIAASPGISHSDLLKNVESIAKSLETIAGAIGKRSVAKKPKKKPVIK